MIDSSPMYGSAESVAGDLVAELGLREKLFIATKVWTRGREDGIREMERSFQRLRVKQMDLMQIHNLLDVDVHTKTLNGLESEKQNPLSRHHALHRLRPRRSGEAAEEGEIRFPADQLFARRAGFREAPSALLPAKQDRRDRQPPLRRGRDVQARARQAAAALGGGDRRRELGAVLPQVDRRPPGGHLRDPRHRQARAHRRQRRRGLRRAAGRERCASAWRSISIRYENFPACPPACSP